MERVFAATDYVSQKNDNSSFFDESQNRNDSSSKKRKGGDELTESQSKKRFVWPDYLHKQFISAVFDVGLKFATFKELNDIIPSDETPSLEQTKSFIQKFRSFRNFNVNNTSSNNLARYNTSSSNLHQDSSSKSDKQSTAPGQLSQNQIFFGESANEDGYHNSVDIEAVPLTLRNPAPPDIPIDKQLLDSLLSEIGMIGTSITSQTSAVQEMGRSIVKQMRLYSQLVDTLAEIDPSASAAYTNNPSYINHERANGSIGGLGSQQTSRGISQYGSPRGSSSNLQGMARQTYFAHGRSFSPIPMRKCASRESLQSFENGVTSDQIISSMKTAVFSPDSDGFKRPTLQRTNSITSKQSDTDGTTDGKSRRTELSAIYEMRAQMDLHRRLFEWKEDQVLIATAAAAAISDPQQQQQFMQHMMLDQQQQRLHQSMHYPPPPLSSEQFSTMTDSDGLSYRVHPTMSNGSVVYVQQGGPLMVPSPHPFVSSSSFNHPQSSSSGVMDLPIDEQVARERAFSCEILYDPSLDRQTNINSLYLDSSIRGSDQSLLSAHGGGHSSASVPLFASHDNSTHFAHNSRDVPSYLEHNQQQQHHGSSGSAWDDEGALDDFEADLFSFLVSADGTD